MDTLAAIGDSLPHYVIYERGVEEGLVVRLAADLLKLAELLTKDTRLGDVSIVDLPTQRDVLYSEVEGFRFEAKGVNNALTPDVWVRHQVVGSLCMHLNHGRHEVGIVVDHLLTRGEDDIDLPHRGLIGVNEGLGVPSHDGIGRAGLRAGKGIDVAFLGRREDTSHELALFAMHPDAEGPDKTRVGMYHFAWEMDSFESLKSLHDRVLASGVRIGGYSPSPNSANVMFFDPDGNELEAIWEPTEDELAAAKAAGGVPKLVEL